MKKILGLLFAVMLVLGLAGQAAAYFDPNAGLIVSVHDAGVGTTVTTELGVDLGAITDITFNDNGVFNMFAPAGTLDLADFSGKTAADLWMGVFGNEGLTSANGSFFATTLPTAPGSIFGSAAAFEGAASGTRASYQLAGSEQSVITGPNYWSKMDQGTTKGLYAGFNASVSVGEANLETFGSEIVTMYLYKYGPTSSGTIFSKKWNLDAGSNAGTPYIAQIQLRTDGSIWMDATSTTVPIPGAVLLFGSGLLGLFGIRRKMA